MTETEMREVVSAAFATAWPTAAPDIPLVLENEALPTVEPAFVQLTIQLTTSTQRTTGQAGTRRVMRKIWVLAKAWSRAGVGTRRTPDEITAGAPKRGAELLDAAREILEGKSFDGPDGDPVTMQMDAGGPTENDGANWMGLVRVPGWYFETR